jgi:RNA polymerase sigma factor (sigma-70 family)
MQAAFLAHITAHKALIYKVCHTFERDDDLRRDLFQDIVLHLWRAFPNFQAAAKWTTWAYRIALNVAITKRRKPQIITAEWSDTFERRLPDTPYDSTTDERLAALYASINQLNAAEKALILLYLDDISYAEIAEIIGITENNVGVKLNRIKTKLKQMLSET